jgi:competence protein ComEA
MRRFTYVLAILCLWMCAPPAAQQKSARAKPPVVTAAAPVNLNTATVSEIATLPGVGPKAAERIIEYRQKSGGFKKIEELMKVKGIGEKSFLKLKPLITVTEKAGAAR